MELVWGLVLVGCGIFISVYGQLLFRFVLAAMGFSIGFGTAMSLLDSQDSAIRVIISLVVGGIAAGLLYSLISFGIYIAGGLLGVVVGIVVASLLGQLDGGIGAVSSILMIAGAGAGGFFGRRLGDWIIVAATAATGAFMLVSGLVVWFDDRFSGDLGDPSTNLSQGVTLVVFLCIAAISGLAQFNIVNLRRRLLR